MKEILQVGLMSLILIPCCVTDIRERTLPTVWLLICTAVGIGGSIWWKTGWGFVVAGLFPGILLFAVSFLTRGGIGKGDAYLYLAVGSAIGLWNSFILLFTALALASGYGLYLLKIRKKGRKYKLPFAPFTAGGYILLLLIAYFF